MPHLQHHIRRRPAVLHTGRHASREGDEGVDRGPACRHRIGIQRRGKGGSVSRHSPSACGTRHGQELRPRAAPTAVPALLPCDAVIDLPCRGRAPSQVQRSRGLGLRPVPLLHLLQRSRDRSRPPVASSGPAGSETRRRPGARSPDHRLREPSPDRRPLGGRSTAELIAYRLVLRTELISSSRRTISSRRLDRVFTLASTWGRSCPH